MLVFGYALWPQGRHDRLRAFIADALHADASYIRAMGGRRRRRVADALAGPLHDGACGPGRFPAHEAEPRVLREVMTGARNAAALHDVLVDRS